MATINLWTTALRAFVDGVCPTASIDRGTPAIQGVHVTIDRDRLRMMATDRFAVAIGSFGCITEGEGSITVPVKQLKQMSRGKGRVQLTIGEQLTAQTEDTETRVGPVAGEYPDLVKMVERLGLDFQPGPTAARGFGPDRLKVLSGIPVNVWAQASGGEHDEPAGFTGEQAVDGGTIRWLVVLMPVKVPDHGWCHEVLRSVL